MVNWNSISISIRGVGFVNTACFKSCVHPGFSLQSFTFSESVTFLVWPLNEWSWKSCCFRITRTVVLLAAWHLISRTNGHFNSLKILLSGVWSILCQKVEDECLNSSVLMFSNGFYTVWEAELKVHMRDLFLYKKFSATENVQTSKMILHLQGFYIV